MSVGRWRPFGQCDGVRSVELTSGDAGARKQDGRGAGAAERVVMVVEWRRHYRGCGGRVKP